MDKARLRRAIIEGRNRLTAAERERLSLLAQKRLMAQPVWEKAGSVALYVAAKGELDTGLLLDAAWASGKRAYLPRGARGPSGAPDFAPRDPPGALQPGAFAIPAPAPGLPPTSCYAAMSV